jgi:hypothetical protein
VRLEPGEQLSTGKDHYLVSVTVTIPFRNLLMIPERQSHVAQLVLVIVARHDHGGVSQPQRIELPIRVPNERILETADSRAVYPLQLEMRPGPQKISVGVRDRLGRVDSTLSLALDVGAVQALPVPPGFWIWRRSERAAEPATLVAKR